MKIQSLKHSIIIFAYAVMFSISILFFVISYTQQQVYLKTTVTNSGINIAKQLAFSIRAAILDNEIAQLGLLVDSVKQSDNILWVAIQNSEGKILAQNNMPDKWFDLIDNNKPQFDEMLVTTKLLHTAENGLYIKAISTLEIESGYYKSEADQNKQLSLLGVVHIGFSLAALEKMERTILLQYLIVLIIVIAIVTFITLRFADRFVKPINWLVTSMNDMAQSRGDLTKRIELKREDELGHLADSFNHFVDNIHNIITKVSRLIIQLRDSLETISSTSEEINASADEVSNNVQMFTADFKDQETKSLETSEVLTKVVGGLFDVVEKAQKASDVFKETQVASTTGKESLSKLVDMMDQISNNNKEVVKRIKELTDAIIRIDLFVNDIQKIGGQTNLLSLNAGIEATRAGEAGRGFSIVAEEVRKLAESASLASKNVRGVIEKIQHEMNATHQASNQESDVVKKGWQAIDESVEALAIILKKANQASGLSNNMSEEMQNQSQKLKQLKESTDESTDIEKKNLQLAEGIAASVEEQTASLEEVNAAIQNLGNMAMDIEKEIITFKT